MADPTSTQETRPNEIVATNALEEAVRRPGRQMLGRQVRQRILEDYIQVGAERLPSEKILSERYGVSRVTVRTAITSLQDSGLVRTRQGAATLVVPQSAALRSGLDRLSSVETFARELGSGTGTEDFETVESTVDAEMAERLEAPEGHPLLVVRYAKTHGPNRVAWMEDYVPAGIYDFDRLRANFAGSVLDLFLADERLNVASADCEVRAITLDASQARRLKVKQGRPALFYEEVLRNGEGRALEYGRVWALSEHFRFFIRRRRDL